MNAPEITRRPLKSRDTKWANAVANRLVRAGIEPNAISVAGTLFAAVAGVSLITAGRGAFDWHWALLMILSICGMQCRLLCNLFGLAMLTGGIGSVVLFGLTSFLALREFITLTPTKLGDHRTLFWVFFIITPLQYYLVATHWYGLFSILIPVYAFLFVPLRSAISGDCEHFFERTAKIQWGLMVCVYCVSYAPAVFFLNIPGYEGQNGKLLFYFILVVQISDVLQYAWGKTFGRHKIAPTVSPSKTWEGFIGGVLSATAIGAALWWATPFTPLQSAGVSLAITLMGFAGGLVMSAIKRDRGVKDYGTMIEGHGGVMDRIDSICFAAPVFFHLTRYFFT